MTQDWNISSRRCSATIEEVFKDFTIWSWLSWVSALDKISIRMLKSLSRLLDVSLSPSLESGSRIALTAAMELGVSKSSTSPKKASTHPILSIVAAEPRHKWRKSCRSRPRSSFKVRWSSVYQRFCQYLQGDKTEPFRVDAIQSGKTDLRR
jgi:hypothetical protein